MDRPTAEEFALPSYKWLGERRTVPNRQGWHISMFPGGIGFSFYNYSDEKALRIDLRIEREDGVVEHYLTDAYHCGEWGGSWQKWQTHRLPLFPYEGLHGRAKLVTFSYAVRRDDDIIPSRYRYRFANLDDFHRDRVSLDGFCDQSVRIESGEPFVSADGGRAQAAYEKLNTGYDLRALRPLFTRGNTESPDHPIHAIHMAIDRVIEQKVEDPDGDHSIRLAMFDFDNWNVANHLVYAKSKGVNVECVGEWAQVSSMNVSENIALLRRASIPVYGVVRNDPYPVGQDIASMHTKIMLLDSDVVHSASYNLHFHLWGGNWENGIALRSREAALLYGSVYDAIRYGRQARLSVDPSEKFNLYYSFGAYEGPKGRLRPQDAILTEIGQARRSIVVCMFELARLKGVPIGGERETDVVEALIQARDRGVRVRILVNGTMAHAGPEPATWDKLFGRPLKEPIQRLKDAWMEVFHVYYWESIHSPLHHKFAVIDERTVITGSYNWYEPSTRSDEVFTVIRDDSLASAFLTEAELMLRSFRIERE